MSKIEHDDITGTATTGHEWDGIKELNTPLPRWWLYTFYATIAWAAVYLASDEAKFITGQVLSPNGGWHMSQ